MNKDNVKAKLIMTSFLVITFICIMSAEVLFLNHRQVSWMEIYQIQLIITLSLFGAGSFFLKFVDSFEEWQLIKESETP